MARKTRETRTAEKTRERAYARAQADVAGVIPAHQANHLIPPVRDLDAALPEIVVDDTTALPLGVIVGGINDYKILRGSVVSLNVTTSIEYRHLATDLAVMSKGNLLILAAYAIPRAVFFDDPEDEDEDDEDAE